MNTAEHTLVYATCGGMLGLPELRLAAETAQALGDGIVRFTDRQELILRGLPAREAVRLLKPASSPFKAKEHARQPAVVTSACAVGLPGAREWLTRGMLAETVAAVQPNAFIEVTIADPSQIAVPALTSRLNILAAAQRDLWHLQLSGTVLPGTVRTRDLPAAVRVIQACIGRRADFAGIEASLRPYTFQLVPTPWPRVESYALPPEALFIPGLHGIRAAFVIDLCLLLANCAAASVSVSPWRECCLRGVAAETIRRIQMLLLQHHVAPGLPWSRVCCRDSRTTLAQRLQQNLAVLAPCDANLSWTLVEKGETPPEAHIAIVCGSGSRWSRPRFTLMLREGPAARATEWLVQKGEFLERDLPGAVLDAVTRQMTATHTPHAVEAPEPHNVAARHVCGECFTEYSAEFGDPNAGVAAGTAFEGLPGDWLCPVCGAAKQTFAAAA